MVTMPRGRDITANEPVLNLESVAPSAQKEVVRLFYKEMWDRADKSLIPVIFHQDFTFRGSLGPVLRGYEEFGVYVDWVTGALGDYTSDILTLVEEGNRVSGRLRFHGVHRREMFGVARRVDTCGGTVLQRSPLRDLVCEISGYSVTCMGLSRGYVRYEVSISCRATPYTAR